MMDAARADFIEAAIYKARKGREAGQYVATCAKDECGYMGASNAGRAVLAFRLEERCDTTL
jgi:hypothetical protein